MPGYVITCKNNGREEFFPSEEIPLELFGKAQWRQMQRGYYLPWIIVKEVKPICESPIKTKFKIVEENMEEECQCSHRRSGHEIVHRWNARNHEGRCSVPSCACQMMQSR